MHSRFAKCLPVATLLVALLAPLTAFGAAKTVTVVDVNQATAAELLKVPGMTPSWAARIVRFRPYRSKLDLLYQGVVPPEVYQRIRDGVVAHRVETTKAADPKQR
jgi:DNA uptake protein ComE-like DNA-binding protein